MPSDKALFRGLDDAQAAAVRAVDGPVLVIAGPGSGKTRVATRRIAYLIQQKGVRPEEILGITFTKKAAGEMAERTAQLLGASAPTRGLHLCTFHSIGLRMLKENAHLVGRTSKLSVIGEAEQRRIIRRIIDESTGKAPLEPSEVAAKISEAKNLGMEAAEYREQAKWVSQEFVSSIFDHYEKLLLEMNAVDFDDMVLLTSRYILSDKKTRKRYQRRWRYLLVDEYQDTNGPQFETCRYLVEGHQNIFCVGDDDQSIYSFRGAEVKHILGFAGDFPGTRLFLLEKNYRSYSPVVDVANSVIEHVPQRYKKALTSEKGDGIPVQWIILGNEKEELDYVEYSIREATEGRGEHSLYPQDIAILFRVTEHMETFRRGLLERDVPVRNPRAGTEGVQLMTIHSAKGLEFFHVIIPAMEEETLPHHHALRLGGDSLNEERRLFYVGLTRAEVEIQLISVRERDGHSREPTRFLTELGDHPHLKRA